MICGRIDYNYGLIQGKDIVTVREPLTEVMEIQINLFFAICTEVPNITPT
jgi:hypothetical protein